MSTATSAESARLREYLARSRWRRRSTRRSDLAQLVDGDRRPVHVGFQRRFDRGYQRAQQAVAAGELGFVHSIRAQTHDQAPPHAAYIPTSGGLFRDCSIHDFDIIRFVTGREVASVYATGANKGAAFFSEAGDVDTAAAVLTLDDGTLVNLSATRYNGARPRRAHGGPRQRRHDRRRLRRLARRHLRRAGRRPTRPARATGRSWSASCPPTAPS